jgi:PAS domain S-box-containing protein
MADAQHDPAAGEAGPEDGLGGRPEGSLETGVRRAQLRGHLHNAGVVSLVSLGCGLLAVWALQEVIEPGLRWAWLAVLGAWMVLRWAVMRPLPAVAAAAGTPGAIAQGLRRLRALSFGHGLVWGSLAWLLTLPADPQGLVTLTVVLAGVAALTMAVVVFDGRAVLLFLLPTLLPLLWQLLRAGGPMPRAVVAAALLMVLLSVALTAAARQAQRRRREVVSARLADLARLQQSQHAEKLMRRVFDHVGEGLALFDAQWRLQAWNDRMFSLMGVDPALARSGTPLRDCLLALARQGEYGTVDPDTEADRRLAAMTRPGVGIWQRTRPDGRTVEVRRSLMADGGLTLVCVDITERRESELALLDNRRMLALLLENTEEGFWFIDNELVTTDANRAMCRMLRATREQMLGRTIYDFVDAENEAVFRQQVALRAQGRAGSYEIALRRTDGTLVHCYNNATPIHDAAGVKVGAVGLFSDISAQKQAAAELQRTTELLAAKTRVLESTLESLSQGVMSVAPDGRIEAWNRRVLELLQVPESVLQQHPTLRELIEWQLAHGMLGPPDEPRDSGWLNAAHRFAEGDAAMLWSTPRYQRQRGDGTVIEVQLHRAPEGAQVRTYSDVTDSVRAQAALRASESRFRTMADAAPAFIWQSGPDGRATWLNQRWLQCLGCSMDEALAAHWRTRIHDDDYDRCHAGYLQAMAVCEPFELEYRVQTADGSELWIVDHGSPHLDGDGRFDGYIVYGWDITARKSAERSLIAARDEAERANRAKSEFLSRMSHELRTPLNAVLGFAQLIEQDGDEALGPMQRERVQQIQRGGAHLLQLINEVLDLARIESGALNMQVDRVDVDAVVDECRRLVDPMARQQGVELRFQAPAGSLGTIHADATRLRQVLLNLLSNAIKYNRAGGRVVVHGRGDGEQVRIEVADTGPGLTPAQQERLFQAFERLDADRGAIEGTGIGLALSKSLVDLMHGRIGVDSQPGHGSTFWVELPRGSASAPTPRDHAVPAALNGAAAPVWSGPPRRVLYIEDNPVNQIIVESMLGQMPGVSLTLASEPEQGLALAQAQPPHLVLLDIQLPRLSGFDVLRRLRTDPATRAVPVIAVSANAMPEDVARARAAGFDAYLTKPLNLAELLDAVSQRLPDSG